MNNRQLNGLRLNLTVMNTLVLIGLSIFIAVLFFMTMQISREAEINNMMEAYCAQIKGEMDRTSGTQSGNVPEMDHGVFQEALSKNDVTYVVWNELFEKVSSSDELNLTGGVLLGIVKRYVAEVQSSYWITRFKTKDQDYKICTFTFVSAEGAMKTIQVLKNMADERSTWFGSLWILGGAVLIIGAAAALCGYFLSGRALVPIKKNMDRQQEFMADASHELRTPIAVIRTNLEVVRESDEESVSSQMEWLDNAYGETKRMHHIVEDMMFLARADSQVLPENSAPVDMNELCASMVERMSPVAAEKNIKIFIELPEEPMIVEGDEDQLNQLMIILLDNGVKYSDRDSEMRVLAERNENHVAISVIDQGIGIPPEEQEKIFQRFYRVDKVRSRSAGGTGLGLSIAAYIVERHKGTIDVISSGENGTTMRVILPVIGTGMSALRK